MAEKPVKAAKTQKTEASVTTCYLEIPLPLKMGQSCRQEFDCGLRKQQRQRMRL